MRHLALRRSLRDRLQILRRSSTTEGRGRRLRRRRGRPDEERGAGAGSPGQSAGPREVGSLGRRCLNRSVPFVLVSGPPGSGKSTLAAPLAWALDWPVISKDAIKEALADSLGVESEGWG